MKLYKLTDENANTKNGTTWEEGISHSIKKKMRRPKLCTSGILHAYKSVELALLLNPIHAQILSPRIWEAEGKIINEDFGKVGCYELKTTKELPIPDWYKKESTRKRVLVQFAILCAESVVDKFNERYPNDNRVNNAIQAAKNYLKNIKYIYNAADTAAVDTADAAYAAYTTAAYAAYTTAAYTTAAYAARATARAAAYAAADAAADVDFNDLAKEAVSKIMGELQ